jgi:hypothetical protein
VWLEKLIYVKLWEGFQSTAHATGVFTLIIVMVIVSGTQ